MLDQVILTGTHSEVAVTAMVGTKRDVDVGCSWVNPGWLPAHESIIGDLKLSWCDSLTIGIVKGFQAIPIINEPHQFQNSMQDEGKPGGHSTFE